MTNPKVREKEMLEGLAQVSGLAKKMILHTKPLNEKELLVQTDQWVKAVRALVLAVGNLEAFYKRLRDVNAEGYCDGDTQMFLDELGIFWGKLYGDFGEE